MPARLQCKPCGLSDPDKFSYRHVLSKLSSLTSRVWALCHSRHIVARQPSEVVAIARFVRCAIATNDTTKPGGWLSENPNLLFSRHPRPRTLVVAAGSQVIECGLQLPGRLPCTLDSI